jgi:hypothetical protein
MAHPNRWEKRNLVTPKDGSYHHHRQLERAILQALAAPRAVYSYATLLTQIDPAKTGEGATNLERVHCLRAGFSGSNES